jgi:probable phosphoglycerate mutase
MDDHTNGQTELWLIRHGQTDWNLDKRYQGQTDIPLNETGLAQASELAASLEGNCFDAIYSSDLGRALRTAEVLSKRLSAHVIADVRLREASFGRWEGEKYFEMRDRFPELWEKRKDDPNSEVAPGGETLPQVAERMEAAVGDMAARHPGGRLLLVSHGLSLSVLICRLTGKPLNDSWFFIMDNAHPTVLKWGQKEQVLEQVDGIIRTDRPIC